MNAYIGKPWSRDGVGPDSYSCWGLLTTVQRQWFDRSMPSIVLGDVAACKAVYKEALATRDLEIVTNPIHGDAVLLRGGDYPHVGIWLSTDGGGVLHSLEGFGVIFSRRPALRGLGMNRLTFYRPS